VRPKSDGGTATVQMEAPLELEVEVELEVALAVAETTASRPAKRRTIGRRPSSSFRTS